MLKVFLLCDIGQSDQETKKQEAHEEDAKWWVGHKRVARDRVDEHAADPPHDWAQRVLLVVPIVKHDRRP